MATFNLEEITTQYKSFVDDQVLTADQLNTIIKYFDDQHRLTRVCLIGVGVLCGMDVTSDDDSISISKGCGVTTDGDLVAYKGHTYTHVIEFEDSNANYPRFFGLSPMDKLITADQVADHDDAIALKDVEGIENKVVVLYLENFAAEQTPCLTVSCDNQGQDQVARIHILLLDKTAVENFSDASFDPIFDRFNNTGNFINLPEIDVPRVVLRNSYLLDESGQQVIADLSNTVNYNSLKESYRDAIINSNVLSDLTSAIISLYSDFESLIDSTKLEVKNASDITNLIKSIFDINALNVPLDIQYLYDLLKDLVATYEEIKCLLFDLRVQCCPDNTSFPKHLLLGELELTSSYYECRHRFYPTPIHQQGQENLQQVRSLINRFYRLLVEYTVNTGEETEIKITPSKTALHLLSDRSIPYYLRTSDSLINFWDFNKTKKYLEKENLAYHRTNLSLRAAIQEPLDYSLDSHNFYRIEGHLGKDYNDALTAIDAIKNEKGLAFDVKALSIDETLERIDLSEYECEFKDLNAVLKAWQTEQQCLFESISTFFSGFSITEAGRHNDYELFSKRKRISGLVVKTKDLGDAVIDSLNDDRHTLGVLVKSAVDRNPRGSAADIYNDIQLRINNQVNLRLWTPDQQQISLYQPAEILAFSYSATQLAPVTLSDLNDENVDAYAKLIEQSCSRIDDHKKFLTAVTDFSSVYEAQGYEQEYALLLNQIAINCCAAEKIQVLLEEIELRKEELLKKKLLSEFIEHHTGAEHLAGVEPGGTFILVYKGKGAKIPDLSISDNALTAKDVSDDVVLVGDRILDFNDRTRDLNINSIDRNIFPISGLINVLEPIVPVSNISENTVVADFALPYLCCSDCAPISFIVPKQTVVLRLPVGFICFDEETGPLLFEVEPTTGVVTADLDDGIDGGVVYSDGRYYFDPNRLDPALYGEAIYFKVNDQITNTKIIAFQKPEFDFEASDPVYIKENTVAVVDFTVTGEVLPDGVTYQWDFGDFSDEGNQNERNPRHRYELPVNKSGTVTVTLQVSNGLCTHSVSHDLTFETLQLEQSAICLGEDFGFVSFRVTPVDAIVEPATAVAGLSIGEDQLILDPSAFMAYDVQIPFNINGEFSGQGLMVYKRPKASFTTSQIDFDLIIRNTSENADSYTWIINGRVFETKSTDDIIRNITPESPEIWSTTLIANSETCKSDEVSDDISVVIPGDDPISFKLNTNETCLGSRAIVIGYSLSPSNTPIEITTKVPGLTINEELNQITIDPLQFNAYDVAIEMSAGDVTQTLIIHQQPQASFTVEQVENQIIISNTSLGGDAYDWIVNGSAPELGEDENPLPITLSPDDPAIWDIQLEAKSENCLSSTFRIPDFRVELPDPNVVLTIEEPECFVEGQELIVSYTLETNSSSVALEYDDSIRGMRVESERIVFEPTFSLFETPIEFSAGDQSETLIIHIMPVAAFEVDQSNGFIIFTNNSKYTEKFEWKVDELETIELGNDGNPLPIRIDERTPRELTITLTAFSDNCGADSSTTSFIIDLGNSSKCVESMAETLDADYKRLVAFNALDVPSFEEFKKRIVDLYDLVRRDPGRFADGSNNNNLLELFEPLLKDMTEAIENTQDEEQTMLYNLFEYVLQLFYNTIGCQSDEQLSHPVVIDSLNLVKEIRGERLIELPVKPSETFRLFEQNYRSTHADKSVLAEHFKDL